MEQDIKKGKAATAAKNKYQKANYDSMRIVFRKGTKEQIQSVAAANNESINGYIKTAVKAKYKADTGEEIEL